MKHFFDDELGLNGRLEQIENGMYIEHVVPREDAPFEPEEGALAFGRAFDTLRGLDDVAGSFDDLAGSFDAAAVDFDFANRLFSMELNDGEEPDELRDMLLPRACGAPLADIECAMRLAGLDGERFQDASFNDLVEALSQDTRVFCYVQSDALGTPGRRTPFRNADRFVEVCGVDLREPDRPNVRLLDPQNEACRICPLDGFMEAWGAGNCLCYAVRRTLP